MYIVFDTETNGLPRKGATYTDEGVKDVEKWPRIIQLAWAIDNESGDLIRKECKLIKPDGWTIPEKDFWINNGFATAINEMRGHPMKSVLYQFACDLRMCDIMIAHNMDFDYAVACAEMIRYGIKVGKKLEKRCTMKENTYGKWPKLMELYVQTFGRTFEGAHDAGSDVQATAEIFFAKHKTRTPQVQQFTAPRVPSFDSDVD